MTLTPAQLKVGLANLTAIALGKNKEATIREQMDAFVLLIQLGNPAPVAPEKP